MNLQARPYRDATDMAHMKQLLMAGSQANISASYMHPGLLDYHTYYPDMRYPPAEQANRRNLRLWENRDKEPPTLAAWAIFSLSKAVSICSFNLRCMAPRCTRP
ncbi:MAG: hypothetical protein R2867_20640 [Caldilineaceae bacterium]